jgi:hypothetical protein
MTEEEAKPDDETKGLRAERAPLKNHPNPRKTAD